MNSLVEVAVQKRLMIATAESLTGGLLGSALVAHQGASATYLGGIIAYSDAVKADLLGVSVELLESKSAISAEVAVQMALGVRKKLAAASGIDLATVIGISTTGVAGPESLPGHEVGKVFIGISSALGDRSIQLKVPGDRTSIRESTLEQAIAVLREEIANF